MLNINNAPEKGKIYAVLRDKIVFKYYDSLHKIQEIAESEKLLELHLFDKEKEYRAVRTRMKGFVETVIDANTKADDFYEETVYVLGSEKDVDNTENLQGKVTVVNYITYNEDDMVTIRNYRLQEVEQDGKIFKCL